VSGQIRWRRLHIGCRRSTRRHTGRCGSGVNDSGDIPWRTTAWSTGAEDIGSVKTAKSVGEGCRQPSSALRGKTVTFGLQGTALSENDGADAEAPRMTTVSEGSTAGGGATLANEENKKLRRQEQNKTRSHGQQKSASAKGTHIAKKGGTRNKEQLDRHLVVLLRK